MADRPPIDAERLIEDLRSLVRIPSITGSEEAVAAWAAEALRDLGLLVEVVSPDPAAVRADPDWPGEEMPRTALPVVIGRTGRDGGRRIILSGHLDVVPPGDPSTWTADPWAAEIRDGALYGRGACDMKGGVAAILAAVRALGAAGDLDRLAGELVVVLVPSEEDGGQGTLAAIRAGVTGDLAIITEPSNLDIVVAHAGAITFRLTVPGRAAHASQRREGVSALDKLFVLAQALEADEERRNAAETDPLMTVLGLPYPTIIGIVSAASGRPPCWTGSWRMGATASGSGSRLRPPRRIFVPPSPQPAPPTTSCAITRPPWRSRAVGSVRAGALGPPAAGRAGRCRRARHGSAPDAARRAVRRGHADVRQRRGHAVRDVRSG